MRNDKNTKLNIKKTNKSKLNAIFCVEREAKEGLGEDSFYYGAAETSAIIASFDGCGGSGSKRYNNYSGYTGAYVGSRAVSGGVEQWFKTASDDPAQLKLHIERSLNVCSKFEDKTGRLMGSLGKSFPTTAAMVHMVEEKDGVMATAYWAGDSRSYLLDDSGIHQLSVDDLNGEDALSNLTSDGVMTNVISAGAKFELHSKSIKVSMPCVFLTATDGCFGYLTSPMAFEFLVLDSLVEATNMTEWQNAMDMRMKEVAGDDYTLCVAVYGFEEFDAIRAYFRKRRDFIVQRYWNSTADIATQWADYKPTYEKYM